jgi:hypothetical protein
MTIGVKKYPHSPIAGRLIFSRSLNVPIDLIVVCLWALTGLIVTAMVAACVGSEDFAGFFAAAG